jgi:hypothetical protein
MSVVGKTLVGGSEVANYKVSIPSFKTPIDVAG